jgi:hypothetical protein
VTDQLPDVDALRSRVDEIFPDLQADLASLVRIPSVSAAATRRTSPPAPTPSRR